MVHAPDLSAAHEVEAVQGEGGGTPKEDNVGYQNEDGPPLHGVLVAKVVLQEGGNGNHLQARQHPG